MRAIKFRAWDKDKKEIHIFNHYKITEYNTALVFEYPGRNEHWVDDSYNWKQDKYIVMQFTGLKDKNGKEIYEGDILSGHEVEYMEGHKIAEYQILSKVEWDNEDGLWIVIDHPSGEKQWLYDCPSDEIIGNIYEHPHLLKGAK